MLDALAREGRPTLFSVLYAGVGGGYQWVNLYGEDYVNNRTYDATFGGWGWQAWGGMTTSASRLKLSSWYSCVVVHMKVSKTLSAP